MCSIFKILLFIAFASLAYGAVYRSPNNDDVKYWREYSENHLKSILFSQKVDRVKVARNVIMFVGDGMSFATIAAGRVLKGQMNNRSGEETKFVFEDYPHLGLSKTYNTDRQVSDSAGTATALFTGVKTNIGGVCLNPATKENRDRLTSLIDWAQAEGKRTGIVTNTRITHATPACSYAMAASRNYECDTWVPADLRSKQYKDIARQLIEEKPGNKMNVIFGGGRSFLGAEKPEPSPKVLFKGNAELTCNRTDKVNLVEKYLKQFDNATNVKYVTSTSEMNAVDYDNVDHVLGLFANNHMDYESLRSKEPSGQPSLTEMVKAAIKILNNKKNMNGWLLIVEGGKIDQAHHQNHARLALEEMVQFENAIYESTSTLNDDDTLVVVTADHSHSMVFNGYGERGNDIFGMANRTVKVSPYETLIYATGPGYDVHTVNNTFIPISNFTDAQRMAANYMHASLVMMTDAAHTGDDVGVFAKGPGSNLIQGTFEQNYIPYVISFASCIGPAKGLNPQCNEKFHYDHVHEMHSSASRKQKSFPALLISVLALVPIGLLKL